MQKKAVLVALFMSIFVLTKTQTRYESNLDELNSLNGPGNVVYAGTGNIANGR